MLHLRAGCDTRKKYGKLAPRPGQSGQRVRLPFARHLGGEIHALGITVPSWTPLSEMDSFGRTAEESRVFLPLLSCCCLPLGTYPPSKGAGQGVLSGQASEL